MPMQIQNLYANMFCDYKDGALFGLGIIHKHIWRPESGQLNQVDAWIAILKMDNGMRPASTGEPEWVMITISKQSIGPAPESNGAVAVLGGSVAYPLDDKTHGLDADAYRFALDSANVSRPAKREALNKMFSATNVSLCFERCPPGPHDKFDFHRSNVKEAQTVIAAALGTPDKSFRHEPPLTAEDYCRARRSMATPFIKYPPSGEELGERNRPLEEGINDYGREHCTRISFNLCGGFKNLIAPSSQWLQTATSLRV
ncbi:uncharacterized protein LAESUDRAFT_714903 [Laetiporus sulphureus 93-53]|uniref:Uncharacterized protein n=1 Tax=Laetiporus sulphureus 93-53 TaxID=1314785 RepID=A0A165DPN8_9APHY|nr:uncharacterized protein LAESUDRAFT_714903 [Laetiporus sulphureus 93-53]KZT05350.1 hypothetical protein LAESUDRAFT_714903 [Laetiporus sulphureus 93-53]